MPAYRRGQKTKEKILAEACVVFAEKGFRDATHAEICRRAGANVAAINYYFESKESLYRAAFEYLLEKSDTLYPVDGRLCADATPEQRLYAFIRAHLRRMCDLDQLGCLHRLLRAEMLDSTGLLAESMSQRLAQDRKYILGIVQQLVGLEAPYRVVEWCEMSIIGQCFMAVPGPHGEKAGPQAIFGIKASEIDALVNHIFTFSLAGIEAVRRRIQEPMSPELSVVEVNTNPLRSNHDESQH